MAETFGNAPFATLTSSITNVQTTITVSSAALPWPQTAQFRIKFISGEIAIVTGGAGTTTWTVTRGAENTTASSQPAGSIVLHILTAGALAQFKFDTIATLAGTAPISVSAGIITIADATASVKGAMSTAYAALLDTAQSTNSNNSLVKRDSNGDFSSRYITGTRFYSTDVTVDAGSPVSIIGVSGADHQLRRYNPSNLVAGTITSQANSATITADAAASNNTIVLRNGSGGIVVTAVNNSQNDALTSQPYMLWGRDVSSGILRTFNPANITVGAATNAGFSSTSGTANNATNWVGHAMYSPNGTYAVSAGGTIVLGHGLGVQPRLWTAFFATLSEGSSAVATHPIIPGLLSQTYTNNVIMALMDSSNITFRNDRAETAYIMYTVMA